MGQGLLIHEVFRSHSDAPQLVGLLWTSVQHSQQTNVLAPVGFEPTISAGERPQTYTLDRAATLNGNLRCYDVEFNRRFAGIIVRGGRTGFLLTLTEDIQKDQVFSMGASISFIGRNILNLKIYVLGDFSRVRIKSRKAPFGFVFVRIY